MLSDRSELFLVPQGSWRGAKRGGGVFPLGLSSFYSAGPRAYPCVYHPDHN